MAIEQRVLSLEEVSSETARPGNIVILDNPTHLNQLVPRLIGISFERGLFRGRYGVYYQTPFLPHGWEWHKPSKLFEELAPRNFTGTLGTTHVGFAEPSTDVPRGPHGNYPKPDVDEENIYRLVAVADMRSSGKGVWTHLSGEIRLWFLAQSFPRELVEETDYYQVYRSSLSTSEETLKPSTETEQPELAEKVYRVYPNMSVRSLGRREYRDAIIRMRQQLEDWMALHGHQVQGGLPSLGKSSR